jgi:hypothetical protein
LVFLYVHGLVTQQHVGQANALWLNAFQSMERELTTQQYACDGHCRHTLCKSPDFVALHRLSVLLPKRCLVVIQFLVCTMFDCCQTTVLKNRNHIHCPRFGM